MKNIFLKGEGWPFVVVDQLTHLYIVHPNISTSSTIPRHYILAPVSRGRSGHIATYSRLANPQRQCPMDCDLQLQPPIYQEKGVPALIYEGCILKRKIIFTCRKSVRIVDGDPS